MDPVVGLVDRDDLLAQGISETGMSLRLASASGMPTMVTAIATALMTWPMASHSPATNIQMTLPISAPVRGPGLSTTVRPNGHSANNAMRAEAKPKGMVMMRTKQTRAASR